MDLKSCFDIFLVGLRNDEKMDGGGDGDDDAIKWIYSSFGTISTASRIFNKQKP